MTVKTKKEKPIKELGKFIRGYDYSGKGNKKLEGVNVFDWYYLEDYIGFDIYPTTYKNIVGSKIC